MSTIKMDPAPGQLANIISKDSKKSASDLGPNKRDSKMLEAAKSFENQFIRQMISEMRKTVPKDELTEDSMADNIFREQLDDQYADMWTEQGGIGLADLIYGQLYEKYGPQNKHQPKGSGEFLNIPVEKPSAAKGNQGVAQPGNISPKNISQRNISSPQNQKPRDIFSDADKQLFLMKKTPEGLTIKSREPLAESVSLRSPMSGVVLQAAALDDGRQMVVLRHDQGLVTRFVHTGDNRVKNNVRVAAGEIIAELPASKKGEPANVVFELRQAVKTE